MAVSLRTVNITEDNTSKEDKLEKKMTPRERDSRVR